MIAIGNGVIADIALPAERGKYLGVFQLGPTIGPACMFLHLYPSHIVVFQEWDILIC